jgi:Ca2+-binding EF-hand superfamily protein
MSRCFTAMLLAVLVSTAAMAQDSEQAAKAEKEAGGRDPRDSAVRFVLLATKGPIVVEARLTIDGAPFYTEREKLVEELLAAADRDDDGKVTLDEAGADARFMFGRNYSRGGQTTVLERLDRNRDKIIDRNEASLHVDSIGGPVFRLLSTSAGVYEPDLRKLLDTSGDGALSEEELEAAAGRLASRDANDNELVEAAELMQSGYGAARGIQVINQGGRRVSNQAAHVLGPQADLVTLHETMKLRYARQRRLTQASLSLDDARFKKLDMNDSGALEPGEAIGWHLLSPQLTLAVDLYSSLETSPRVSVLSCDQVLSPKGEQRDANPVEVAGLGADLRFTARGTLPPLNFASSASTMMTRYDKDKNGYIEKKELTGQANAQYFTAQFAAWDADGDGKVFAKEIQADYERRLRPSRTRVGATAAERAAALFSTLDTSGDGRLSIRERRAAAARLKQFDKDADGQISSDEIPARIDVNFAVGREQYAANFARGGVGLRNPRTSAAADEGPSWFVHMDTNGDGDVSPREFLGERKTFDQLDTDEDGLLSREEARRAKAEGRKGRKVKGKR